MLVTYVIALAIVAPLAYFALMPILTFSLLGIYAVTTPFIRRPVLALAALLGNPKNERALKIGSALLLAVGFHFDLLSA